MKTIRLRSTIRWLVGTVVWTDRTGHFLFGSFGYRSKVNILAHNWDRDNSIRPPRQLSISIQLKPQHLGATQRDQPLPLAQIRPGGPPYKAGGYLGSGIGFQLSY